MMRFRNFLKIVAVREVRQTAHRFLSNLFLVRKKDGGNQPVINLRDINSFVPY